RILLILRGLFLVVFSPALLLVVLVLRLLVLLLVGRRPVAFLFLLLLILVVLVLRRILLMLILILIVLVGLCFLFGFCHNLLFALFEFVGLFAKLLGILWLDLAAVLGQVHVVMRRLLVHLRSQLHEAQRGLHRVDGTFRLFTDFVGFHLVFEVQPGVSALP